jgi:polyisoprenoid-binding protein YceI
VVLARHHSVFPNIDLTIAMTRRLSAILASVLSIVLLAAFGLSAPVAYEVQPDASTMTISGTSTLHDWSCDVPDVNGQLQVDTAAASAPMAIPSTQIRVPVEQIECNKDRMNKNLREALKANAYPTIYFMLKEAQTGALPDSSGTWYTVDASGQLIIAGERRTLDLPVNAERLDDGRLRFVGSTSFKMSDWGVEPPSVMLGTINTGDEVTIDFDVVVAPRG